MEETTIQDMTREANTCMDEQALRKTCMDLAKSADKLTAIIHDYGDYLKGQKLGITITSEEVQDMVEAEK